jgi:hypothetical protein
MNLFADFPAITNPFSKVSLYCISYIFMTSNQTYGSHYSRAHSSKKDPIGKTTLEFLVKNDQGNYIHTQENIAQRSRHGLFSQPMGLANGDHYHDAKRTQT